MVPIEKLTNIQGSAEMSQSPKKAHIDSHFLSDMLLSLARVQSA